MNRMLGVMQVVIVAALAVGAPLPSIAIAQEAAAVPAAPGPEEHVFAAKFDEVWEAALHFLKSRPMPIPVASAEKEVEKTPQKGVITTQPLRYFKIASAAFPPREQQYRDTYTVTITALPKGPPPANPPVPGVPPLPPDKPVDLTKVQVERKFEKFNKKTNGWVDGDPSKDKAGVSAADLFTGIQYQLTPPPPPPPPEE